MIFCYFDIAILDFTQENYNLIIKDRFTRFLDHENVGIAIEIIDQEARYLQLFVSGHFSDFGSAHFRTNRSLAITSLSIKSYQPDSDS